MRIVLSLLFIFFLLCQQQTQAQKKDSLNVVYGDTVLHNGNKAVIVNKDSLLAKKHDPGKASLYSAIIPGAGQIYNHKYWKLPLVYAAIGIPAYTFFYNKGWYQKLQYALAVSIHGSQGDSLAKVNPQLKPLLLYPADIITLRDSYRKDEDYSVLFFLLFWGLNVVDATVDAHLRDFNVNSDLSFKIKPVITPWPTFSAGVSVVFDIHSGKPKGIDLNQ